MSRPQFRQFLVINRAGDQALSKYYAEGDVTSVKKRLLQLLRPRGYMGRAADFEITALPSREWILESFEYSRGAEGKHFKAKREALQPVPTLDIGLVVQAGNAVETERALINLRKAIGKDRGKKSLSALVPTFRSSRRTAGVLVKQPTRFLALDITPTQPSRRRSCRRKR